MLCEPHGQRRQKEAESVLTELLHDKNHGKLTVGVQKRTIGPCWTICGQTKMSTTRAYRGEDRRRETPPPVFRQDGNIEVEQRPHSAVHHAQANRGRIEWHHQPRVYPFAAFAKPGPAEHAAESDTGTANFQDWRKLHRAKDSSSMRRTLPCSTHCRRTSDPF